MKLMMKMKINLVKVKMNNINCIKSRSQILVFAILTFAFLLNQSSTFAASDDPLPPEEVFILSGKYDKNNNIIEINYDIREDYYLYHDKIKVKTNKTEDSQLILAPTIPDGITYQDPYFGEMQIFRNQLNFEIPVQSLTKPLSLEINVQGCKEKGICYPPFSQTLNITPEGEVNRPVIEKIVKNKDFLSSLITSDSPNNSNINTQFSTPITTTANPTITTGNINTSIGESETDRLAREISEQNIFLTLVIFFGLGVALSLTPCVLPMVPILGALIIGKNKVHSNHNFDFVNSHELKNTKPKSLHSWHNFFLSVAFVFGTSITYASVGVFAGLGGALLTSALQLPAVQISTAIIMMILALACFGAFRLQMPNFIQNYFRGKADKASHNFGGLIIAGALSALIIGPCVAAPLIAILLYIGKSGSAIIGGVLLFVLAWGQGLPLLLFGIFSDKAIPKLGKWMESVNHFFGFLLILLSIWIISPLINNFWEFVLYGSFLIISSVFLRVFEALPSNAHFMLKIIKALGVIILIYGITLLIGAFSDSNNLINPLDRLTNVSTNQSSPTAQNKTLLWQKVTSINEYEATINNVGISKPIIIKFSADWCVSCKELETFTFPDIEVQNLLASFYLIEIDVSKNDAQARAILEKFNIFGPPAIIFFNKKTEARTYRLIGVESASKFALRLNSVLQEFTKS